MVNKESDYIMEDITNIYVLHKIKTLGNPFEITVSGISMNPILLENDVVTIQPLENYYIGDIIVFTYKYGELLIHRLVDIQDSKYFCKGDNSFRLEDIEKKQIIGKAIALKRGSQLVTIPQCSKELITLSKGVHRAFFKCRYNIQKTKSTDEYKQYERFISTFIK